MTVTFTTTGATDRGSIIKGDVGFISGTWAGSAGTGRIVTGGSTILGHDITISDAAGGTAIIRSKKNVDGDGNAEAGSIGILDIAGMPTGAGTAAIDAVSGDWITFVRL